jgi:hypothetical protein
MNKKRSITSAKGYTSRYNGYGFGQLTRTHYTLNLNCEKPSLPQIIEKRLGMDYKTFEQKALEWAIENE